MGLSEWGFVLSVWMIMGKGWASDGMGWNAMIVDDTVKEIVILSILHFFGIGSCPFIETFVHDLPIILMVVRCRIPRRCC